jgi:hypothetical protein
MSRSQQLFITVLGLFGMVLIIVTHMIRPFLLGNSQEIVFIFGILPNFAAAFSLPFLMLGVSVRMPRVNTSIAKQSLIFVIMTISSIVGLIIWEVLQNVFWNISIDINDIRATVIGGILAILVYSLHHD